MLFSRENILAAESTELRVDKKADNLVKFISDAPIEQFEGITNNIDGYIFWEGEDLTKNSQIYFEVDLNTIDTGIGLRNRHMRDNYLETNLYRFTNFEGKITEAEDIGNGITDITAEGTISIHGVVKPLIVKGEIKKHNRGYNITTGFSVKLSDFNIDIPTLIVAKLNEVIELQLNFSMIEFKNL